MIKFIVLLAIGYALGFLVHRLVVNHYFPDGSKLVPDEKGIIHHPWYGDYPAVVPFEQGMSIMPGQHATLMDLQDLGKPGDET